MNNKHVSDIKRAQKESLLFKTISKLFLEATINDSSLLGFSVNRVALSPDKGYCYVYFWAPGGQEEFKKNLEQLKLYKPSLRAALAKEIAGRYTPEIVFKFDTKEEKVQRIDELLEELKRKGDL